jgi:phage protein D
LDFAPKKKEKKKRVFVFDQKQQTESTKKKDQRRDMSKDAARERKRRFVDCERESQKKSAAADAVVVVAAPITPLKKGEEENARVSFFFSLSLSLFLCVRALKYAQEVSFSVSHRIGDDGRFRSESVFTFATMMIMKCFNLAF